MGFVEVEEDKKPGNSPPFMVWRDEGACWHKNTRNRLWICIVIKLYIYFMCTLAGTVFSICPSHCFILSKCPSLSFCVSKDILFK
jgi:hypothetical protein